MITRSLSAIIVLALTLQAQHHHDPPAKAMDPAAARLLEGTGTQSHPVSTKNQEAQKFFDQGLRMMYGFNHGEAVRSFRRAADLDPQLAMAWWGVAIARGPNYNAAMLEDAHKEAYQALQKARSLEAGATQRERDYIAALSARYSANPKDDVAKLQQAFADAMRSLAKKYPYDLDAQTLFAESLMNLYPWKLWTLDGKPSPVTEEAVATLESVLVRDPNHLGANHYYIHAVEASKKPEIALSSADRLGRLAPQAGHLVHMPAHIYMRTGDYDSAAKVNIDAAAADKHYLAHGGVRGFYVGLYAHNLHFLSAAYSMQGRYADSQQAAEECRRVMEEVANQFPGFEGPTTASMLVPVRFHDWQRILKMPEPDSKQITLHNLWHFARGMAYVSTGNVKQALAERDLFRTAIEKLPEDRHYGANPERQVMKLPLFLLEAKLAEARDDLPTALGHLREAVGIEDGLSYNEPPDWYYPPSREALGAMLLKMKRAPEAEQVFREDLRRNQRNGRSLFGLCESLKAQNKIDGASLIEAQYRTAWSKADRPLQLADLF